MTDTNNEKKKLLLVQKLSKENSPKLPYHNFSHAIRVLRAVRKLVKLEHISRNEKFLLETAALLHDVVYVVGRKDNEDKSAEFARKNLHAVGYGAKQITEIANLILATKSRLVKPKNKLQKILRDADTFNVGTENFFAEGNKIKKEIGIESELVWADKQMRFLETHEYYTNSANNLLSAGKRKNIDSLKAMQAILMEVEK